MEPEVVKTPPKKVVEKPKPKPEPKPAKAKPTPPKKPTKKEIEKQKLSEKKAEVAADKQIKGASDVISDIVNKTELGAPADAQKVVTTTSSVVTTTTTEVKTPDKNIVGLVSPPVLETKVFALPRLPTPPPQFKFYDYNIFEENRRLKQESHAYQQEQAFTDDLSKAIAKTYKSFNIKQDPIDQLLSKLGDSGILSKINQKKFKKMADIARQLREVKSFQALADLPTSTQTDNNAIDPKHQMGLEDLQDALPLQGTTSGED